MPIDYHNKICEGCSYKCEVYKEYYNTLPITPLNENQIESCKTIMKNCPCSKCIVKMICVEVCDKFQEYFDDNIKNIHQIFPHIKIGSNY